VFVCALIVTYPPLAEAVRSRKVKGTIRSLYITDDQHVDFSSNDFLSLARSDDLRKQIAEELLNTGQFLGMRRQNKP
jgi:7-keto-8-aminopelargonate synthetase-like enzyme